VTFEAVCIGPSRPKPVSASCIEGRTITDGIDPGKVVIYPHGYSLRIKVHLDKADAEVALGRCGWSPTASAKVWTAYTPRGGKRRWVMRGSAWLTQRAPSNLRLPMARANQTWRTRIYSLGIEECGTGYALDLVGVRYRDIDRFMREVLQVPEDMYEVDYYRKAERYLVLSAHDAHRLAEDLGGQPVAGRGRLSRKRFLLKDHEVPVTVRRQTQMMATVTIYRIDRGATSQFKCEVALAGKRRDRQQFHEPDIERLDKILLGLVDDLHLAPTYKPARWEPRNFSAPIELGRFDPLIRQLGQKAWRGRSVAKGLRDLVKKCHTPDALVLVENRVAVGTYLPGTCIRTNLQTASTSLSTTEVPEGITRRRRSWTREEGKGFDVSSWINGSKKRSGGNRASSREPVTWKKGGAWKAIAEEVGKLRGHLIEVILDGNQDPGPLIQAVGKHSGGKVGLSALCGTYDGGKTGDTWYSVKMAMLDYPVVDNIDTWVMVVDVSSVQAIIRHIHIIMSTMSPGWDPNRWGVFPWKAWAVGAWLWEAIEGLRDLCERENFKVVLVSTDLRPRHGYGPLHKSHYYKDTRMRSWLGDAGRYLTHQRYRVELGEDGWPDRVVAVKDEAEGLVGRLLYDRPGFREGVPKAHPPGLDTVSGAGGDPCGGDAQVSSGSTPVGEPTC
jgi:hypothetical protein